MVSLPSAAPLGAHQSGDGVAAIAPRIYYAADPTGLFPEVAAQAARLHFDWLAVPAACPGDENLAAALASRVATAREKGLRLLVDIDFPAMFEGRADGVAMAVSEGVVASLLEVPSGGVLCRGAHRVPVHQWQRLIGEAKTVAPRLIWVADTLGASSEATAETLKAGFDFTFSSIKWWDGESAWALDQYERYRTMARSIGFPEEPGGSRLRNELNGLGELLPAEIGAIYSLRYALAAFFGAGVLMPSGYETAASGTASCAAAGDTDISAAITGINRVKATNPYLEEELPQRRLSVPGFLALVKLDEDGRMVSCFAANLGRHGRSVDLTTLAGDADLDIMHLHDVTPNSPSRSPRQPIWLGPAEWRLLVALPAVASIPAQSGPRSLRRSFSKKPSEQAPAIVIEAVRPDLDDGVHPVKRIVGDRLEVSADIFSAGHDVVGAALLIRDDSARLWSVFPMRHVDNDRWVADAPLLRNRRYFYCIEAWIDGFATWSRNLAAKYDAGQDVALEVAEGRTMIAQTAGRARGEARRLLRSAVDDSDGTAPVQVAINRLMAADIAAHMRDRGPRYDVTRSNREIEVVVDRPAARFGAWYEMFPRSQGRDATRSATFKDCIARLSDIKQMGFDVVYLVPIHPIGEKNRKGRNNALVAAPGDPGSPYAIGGSVGGHMAVHPDLGTLQNFRDFVAACTALGMEVALDFAVQCSPDHPWITEHPAWFAFRADGSIKFAENPPKKYQDIVNLDFHTVDQAGLWRALRDVVLFWINQDVRIFRVDNPHTKPYPFWDWLIRNVQAEHPDVIFLAEAFTRPKPLRYLAKLGFTQSYTYFTWRNEKQEITDYFTELTRSETKDYLRPHLFANTPDILPKFLQTGGPAAFKIRLVLAATLAGLYGIYNGFELCEANAIPDSEEYLDSEKYQFKVWDWDGAGNIKPYIAEINRIRRENPAFEDWLNLEFLPCDNEKVLYFGRFSRERRNHIIVAVSLDPFAPQSARLELPWARLAPADRGLQVEHLLGREPAAAAGQYQQVYLDASQPALIQRLQPRIVSGA